MNTAGSVIHCLCDSALNPDEECKSVNWSDASLLAKGVSVRTNELHFWEQREPQVEELRKRFRASQSLLMKKNGRHLKIMPHGWKKSFMKRRISVK